MSVLICMQWILKSDCIVTCIFLLMFVFGLLFKLMRV